MGYTTDFWGRFEFNKTLDEATLDFLIDLSQTRRMQRDPTLIDSLAKPSDYGFTTWGDEGQYCVDPTATRDSVIDHNRPPGDQPGLWCKWRPTSDRKGLEWNGVEKFYHYVKWLEWIRDHVLEPRGYKIVHSNVAFQGEDPSDCGFIWVQPNGDFEIRNDPQPPQPFIPVDPQAVELDFGTVEILAVVKDWDTTDKLNLAKAIMDQAEAELFTKQP